MRSIGYVALLVVGSASAEPAKPVKAPIVLAVVEAIERFDECSGAGGEHYTMRIHDGSKTPRIAHAGGHASHLRLLGDRWSKAPPPPTFFVAEIEMHGPAHDVGRNDGWCLERMPSFDGSVRRLVRAKSRADADRIRARLATVGFREPTPRGGTILVDPPK